MRWHRRLSHSRSPTRKLRTHSARPLSAAFRKYRDRAALPGTPGSVPEFAERCTSRFRTLSALWRGSLGAIFLQPMRSDPHAGQPLLQAGPRPEEADAVLLLAHGRGADA